MTGSKVVTGFMAMVLAGLVWAVPAAMADPIVSGPGTGPGTTFSEYLYDPESGQVTVDDGHGNPLDVIFDPDGGPIIKIFQPLRPIGHTLQIVEIWHVAGPSIGDWHEAILTPGLVWSQVGVKTSIGVGASWVGEGTSVLDIVFDQPLPFCTILTITKSIQVPDGLAGGIVVHEWPTPEPATMALLGVGLAGMLVRRRGRKA